MGKAAERKMTPKQSGELLLDLVIEHSARG
jgi:hypothetical protein